MRVTRPLTLAVLAACTATATPPQPRSAQC